MSDFSKLTAAPCEAKSDGRLWYVSGVITGCDEHNAKFFALARNFADVCERNGWSVRRVRSPLIGFGWVVISRLDNTLAGPFNTVYEAWQGAVDYDIKIAAKASE